MEIFDPYLREDETVNTTHPPTHELGKEFHYARHCCMHGTKGPCVGWLLRSRDTGDTYRTGACKDRRMRPCLIVAPLHLDKNN